MKKDGQKIALESHKTNLTTTNHKLNVAKMRLYGFTKKRRNLIKSGTEKFRNHLGLMKW